MHQWVSTTQNNLWQNNSVQPILKKTNEVADVEIHLNEPLQKIDGFGTCFNELGWESLSLLPNSVKDSIMRELFAPGVGANFSICRMPIGANDFSKNWYSYNENAADFEMTKFDISHDLTTLVPFIKAALKYNRDIKLWASPWSPPSWMKNNQHYASLKVPDVTNWPEKVLQNMRNDWGIDFKNVSNGLKAEQEVLEGKDNFIQEEKYFKSYSLYFQKFIQAYRKQQIKISMVMPQNEFNSPQVFPSCTWTPAGLNRFIKYLGPVLKAQQVDLFLGTMERPNSKLIDTVLNNPISNSFIKGIGFQWAGKDAIPSVSKKYPQLKLYQTEQECGNGYNDWKYCKYSWGLMKHYFNHGTSAYMYWNTSLKEGGRSTWGWHQNSLITVDTIQHQYKFNYEYFLLKHLSHFVRRDAHMIVTTGNSENVLAFKNVDNSVVIVVYNDSEKSKSMKIKIGDENINASIAADSFNTFFLSEK